MKILHKVSVLAASVTIGLVSNAALTNSPVLAQQVRFACKTVNGAPTTVIKKNEWSSVRQMIRWTLQGATGDYTPQRRCEEVTGRLNQSFTQGSQYITHGIMNKQPVICITDKKGNGCQHLLLTLVNHSNRPNPKAVLNDLFSLNDRNFSSNAPLREGSCSVYVNINALIQGKQVIASEVCTSI
ncbi:COP23 domain-containing protein [Nostoc sp. ATCC 53789]|uniref:COP23 domain-containing protein n=1 Tax=Nostoc sp. ATCC 53789 TaxID=76335 RepID=UPI00133154F6|nr:COP23 domain-containing protein [Nostoc sp. ATCC 53789]